MSDIDIYLGDYKEINTPIFDENQERYLDSSDIAEASYAILSSFTSETIVEKTLEDANMELATVGDIDDADFDDLDDSVTVVSVLLTDAETKTLPERPNPVHEMQIVDDQDNINTVFQGDVNTIRTGIDPRQS